VGYHLVLASPLAEILFPESRGTKCGLLLPPAMIVVAMSLLAQTSPPPGKPDGHPESSCSVGGRVVSAVDGSPLRSARVTLVPEHDGEKTQIYAATTDSDGRFLLKDLVPGHYHFAANRTGFVTQSYQAKGTDDGAVLSLRPGEQVSDVVFRMMVSGVVTGRVTNEDGEPMISRSWPCRGHAKKSWKTKARPLPGNRDCKLWLRRRSMIGANIVFSDSHPASTA
jgi:hypothetical protein